MSTIKSSNEHLTLNADGSSKDIKFQANGVEKASISSSGAFTSTTIDATKLTGTIPNFTSTGIDDNADATAMTIDSSERVGIGTGSPTARLHVYNADDHVRLSAQCAQNTGQHWQFQSRNNGEFWLRNETTGSNKFIMDSTGAVTMPSQPAFLVNAGSNTPIALSTDTKVNYSTEVFDQNSDFDTSTQTFTAPVTGKYQFNVQLLWLNWDSGANYYYIQIATSNRTYYELYKGGERSNDVQYSYGHIHVLADMDASDTAFVRITQVGGSVQTYYDSQSIFSGHLVC